MSAPKIGSLISIPGLGPCEIEHVTYFGARVRPLRTELVTGVNQKTGEPFTFRRRPKAVTVSSAVVGATR